MENLKNKAQYNSAGIEEKWYHAWEEAGLFGPDESLEAEPFVITLPPPNVTGILHIGHCLGGSIQDTLIRWARMRGHPTVWVPGTDHASIATEQVVSRQMAAAGTSKHEAGRDVFLERAWAWKEETHGRITKQIRRLGASLDWSREAFTMDEDRNRAVIEAFVTLKEKGLIYRDVYLVNWCPHDQTAISDDEVEYREVEGHLWHIKYPLVDQEGYVTVATTRPETLFGDTAVAVHPDDPERRHLIGQMVHLPLTDRVIPVIGDHHADPEKGTGFVKITPAHDPNDFLVGQRHDLDKVICMTPRALMNENAGQFEGMDCETCRAAVLQALEAEGLLAKTEKHIHQVGHHDRCGTIIEPYLSRQWFLRMDQLAEPAVKAVEDGEITLFPERWVGVYYNWMRNIRDWCISRQLWWGHRIPVWYCEDCGEGIAAREAVESCTTCASRNLRQDEDVLDTWFSSWLWTFSPLGWPAASDDMKKYHPTSVMVTGADIIFFWVARMVMASYEFLGEKPFGEVLFTGIVRDEEGRKMSKSLGNSPDPIDLIDKYGADALRCSLVMLTPTGQDIFFSETTLEVGRNFCNKIFQANRLVLGIWEEAGLDGVRSEMKSAPRTLDLASLGTTAEWEAEPAKCFCELWAGVFGGEPPVELSDDELTLEDRWIINRLIQTVETCNDGFRKRRLNDASYEVFNFFRHEFCDWYLEAVKPRLRDEAQRPAALCVAVLNLGLSYKLLHPVMPFITEELWNWLPPSQGFLMVSSFPEFTGEAPLAVAGNRFEEIKEIVVVIRNLRNELGVQPGKRGRAILRVSESDRVPALEQDGALIALLSKLETVTVVCGGDDPQPAGIGVAGTVEIFLPMEGLVDLEKERTRLEKELAKVEGWIKGCEAKLGNSKFTANAPEQVVAQQRYLLEENQGKAAQLRELLAALA
ncbi:MAG: valine--tRNA ligase [Gemmatimonadales bacterium]|nr:valine--tRNA ligase [Gemmatimonadales bacterium]